MTTTGPRRRWVRAVLSAVMVALVTVGLLGVSAPLVWATGPCQTPPEPVMPNLGMPGLLGPAPDLATVPDRAPDPFTGGGVSIASVYGYAWRWSTYDLGCAGGITDNPLAGMTTQLGNHGLATAATLVAAMDSLETLTKSTGIGWLTDLAVRVNGALSSAVLGGGSSIGWLPVALVAVAVLVGWRAHRADYAATLRTALVVAGCVAAAVFALQYPVTASQTADKLVTAVAATAGSGFGASAGDTVTRQGLYQAWLVGNFGSADTDVAKRLGPRLLAATTFSWSEVKQVRADPGARARIVAGKKADYATVADELRAADRAAYDTFRGVGDSRPSVGWLSVLLVVVVGVFVTIALLMVLIARVLMQALTIAVPVAVVVGMVDPKHAVLVQLWDLFTSAIVVVAKFTVAVGVVSLALGGVQTSLMPGGWRLLWTVVITIAAFAITKPFRSLKTLTPGLDPNRSYLAGAVGVGAHYLASRAGTKAGTQEAIDDTLADDPAPTPTPTAQPVLPPPAPATSASPVAAGQLLPAASQAPRRALAAASTPSEVVIEGEVLPDPTPSPHQSSRPSTSTPATAHPAAPAGVWVDKSSMLDRLRAAHGVAPGPATMAVSSDGTVSPAADLYRSDPAPGQAAPGAMLPGEVDDGAGAVVLYRSPQSTGDGHAA